MPTYPNVDALSELIRKQAYYASGGKDEGDYGLDKFNKFLGTANAGITGYEEVVNNALAKKANELKIQQAEYEQAPEQRALGTRETEAGIGLKEAQADYYRSGQKGGEKLWINPITRGTSDVQLPGMVRVSSNTGATIASSGAKFDENLDFRKQQQEAIEADHKAREEDRKTNMRTSVIAKFNALPNVKKHQSSIEAADTVIDLISSNNPIADSAIPTYMARASGEVGALTEADKAPFGGSQALLARIGQAFQQSKSGKLTPENREFVRQLAETMKASAVRNQINAAKKFSEQYSKVGSYGTAQDIEATISPDLTMQTEPTTSPANPAAPPPSGLNPSSQNILDKYGVK